MAPGFTVLVVDDEPLIGSLVKTLLERVGLKAVFVRTVREALDRMHRSPDVGLVITDLQMPQSSGVELCQTLREEFPQVPVIAMTGSGPAESDDLRRARAAGAKSALQKPFNLADFYDAVNQATWTRA